MLSLVTWCLGAWILSEKKKVLETIIDFFFDPVIMLMMVAGLSTFLIAFCGCFGSLRENTILLQMVRLSKTIKIKKNVLKQLAEKKVPQRYIH